MIVNLSLLKNAWGISEKNTPVGVSDGISRDIRYWGVFPN